MSSVRDISQPPTASVERDTAVFLTPPSIPILGDEAQNLIACNQKLQELGIGNTIKLPRLVVIGDQSTGKSSLIEAISHIKVPKAANLCTRCPIAINLSAGDSPSATWKCTVYVEETFDFNANTQKGKLSKAQPLGPWTDRAELKTTEIRTITKVEDLLATIDIAQQIVLNPRRTTLDSVDVREPEIFSPNTIRLDISFGCCPNLSFVDLPGVIQTAGKDRPAYLVKLVENLAHKYAKDQNNIIMLTLPVNHDVSNSRAYSILQTEKVLDRTMAIFTKVDLARDEERDDCIRRYFVEDDQEFAHGCYVVKLTGFLDAAARKYDEDNFFSQAPWVMLSEGSQARLSIHNLTTHIRKLLIDKTASSIPDNLTSIEARLKEVAARLAAMPAPPDLLALPYELQSKIKDLAFALEQVFSDRSGFNAEVQKFAAQIEHNKPTLFVRTDEEARELSKTNQADNSVDDGDIKIVSTPTVGTKIDCVTKRVLARRFHLSEIREINQRFYHAGVPGEIEPKAVEEMNKQSVRCWDEILEELIGSVQRLIGTQIKACVESIMSNERHLPVFPAIKNNASMFLQNMFISETMMLKRLYEAEVNTPITYNSANLKEYEAEVLRTRRSKRHETRKQLYKKDDKIKKGKGETEDLGVDEWDLEIQMSAKTRAYYTIAGYRFIDNVYQHMTTFLLPSFRHGLIEHLKDQLGLNDIPSNRDSIAMLMTEDGERENYRARLRSEHNRLLEGYNYIRAVCAQLTGEDNQQIESIEFGSDDFVTLNTSSEKSSPNKRKGYTETSLINDQTGSPSKRARVTTTTIKAEIGQIGAAETRVVIR